MGRLVLLQTVASEITRFIQVIMLATLLQALHQLDKLLPPEYSAHDYEYLCEIQYKFFFYDQLC